MIVTTALSHSRATVPVAFLAFLELAELRVCQAFQVPQEGQASPVLPANLGGAAGPVTMRLSILAFNPALKPARRFRSAYLVHEGSV
jgi:hypothetical protein